MITRGVKMMVMTKTMIDWVLQVYGLRVELYLAKCVNILLAISMFLLDMVQL